MVTNIFAKAFICVTVALLVFAADVSAQALNAILDRVESHYENIFSFQAEITMGKADTPSTEIHAKNGKLLWMFKGGAKRDYLRIDWKKPRIETLVMRHGGVTNYVPANKTAYTGTIASSDTLTLLTTFLHFTKRDITNTYRVLLREQQPEKLADGKSVLHIQLTPKVNGGYRTIHLWVDADGAIQQFEFVAKNEEDVFIRFSHKNTKAKLRTRQFVLKMPRRIKRVKSQNIEQ